jgi:hypothetical protein
MIGKALTRGFRRLGLLAALLAPLGLHAQPAPARAPAASTPSAVGYWMGEDMVGPQGRENHGPSSYYQPAYRGDLTEDAWRVLSKYRVPLYLHVRYGRDFGPRQSGVKSDVVALVRKANALGIPVSAWVVIPYEQGYWAYEGNAPEMFEAVKAWAAWKKANRLRFFSVAIDQEFSWQNLQHYVEAAKSGDREKLAAWMRGNIDPSAQCSALQTYRQMISWAHRNGIRVDAALAPQVVDDLADGNLALQNGLQIAGSLRGYDGAYLMAYRSSASASGVDPGSAYAAFYYQAMQKYFGPNGQVSIGIPGQGPYASLATLTDDVRMLVGLGAKEIPVYSLEEMLAAFGPDGIKAVAEAARNPMQGAELAAQARPTGALEGMMAMFKAQNATATELTLAVTRERGKERPANAWPDGCGVLTVEPLAAATGR